MNRRQKEILEAQLKSEKGILNQLRTEYRDALAQINEKIKTFQADIQSKQDALSTVTDQTQRQRLQSEIQSKIYQRDYQKALKGQVSAILDTMNSNQYDRIKDYIENCYEAGYMGTMYDLQGQGIPIIVPIDQTQVVKAVTNDTKLSVPLYTALGYQVSTLKKAVTSEISRGIATSMSWADIARNIQKRTNVTMNQAYRIARTEGHRVQNQAAYDAQHKAKAAGADIVKQWCATLDSRTRPHHAQLDGQLRELDEPFEVDGHNALHPCGFGIAAEDINCRCRLLQRARWALDDDELHTLKERAEYFGLDKTKDFEEFQKHYLSVAKSDKDDIMKLNRNANRREKNTGVFSNLLVSMQKREVHRVAKKYGVDLSGITLKIQRNEKLLALPIAGSTDYKNIGRVDLLPNAFVNEEQLVRTLIHERCHVLQLKKYGAKYAQDNLAKMEKQAYRFENYWYLRLGGGEKQSEMD